MITKYINEKCTVTDPRELTMYLVLNLTVSYPSDTTVKVLQEC